MEKHNHTTAKRKSSLSYAFRNIKHRKSGSAKKTDKNLMQRIFHPDYVLFDWEFFSCELEFE